MLDELRVEALAQVIASSEVAARSVEPTCRAPRAEDVRWQRERQTARHARVGWHDLHSAVAALHLKALGQVGLVDRHLRRQPDKTRITVSAPWWARDLYVCSLVAIELIRIDSHDMLLPREAARSVASTVDRVVAHGGRREPGLLPEGTVTRKSGCPSGWPGGVHRCVLTWSKL